MADTESDSIQVEVWANTRDKKSTAIYAKICNATSNSCNTAINTNIPNTTTIKHSKTRRSKKMRNKMKNVSIMYLNIRGLKSKLESLKEIIDEQKPDIITLVETLLCENDAIELKNYEIIRNDREAGGGGVYNCKGVFKGGGFRGFKPPPEIFRFFFEK